MYAVNISDLTKDQILATYLISPHVKTRTIVKAEKTLDGGAVLLECPPEQLKAIVDVVRMKYCKAKFRFYEGNHKTWKRI